MAEDEAGSTFSICLNTECKAGRCEKVEDETDDISHSHCNSGPEVLLCRWHIIAYKMYQPIVNAVLQQRGGDAYNAEAHHLTEFLPLVGCESVYYLHGLEWLSSAKANISLSPRLSPYAVI